MAQFVNGLSPEKIRAAVAEQYGRVATQPEGQHSFPVGRAFAESLGYPPATLDSLPSSTVNSFTGISNPLSHANLRPGEAVLDLGCGAGLDTILISRQVGPEGRVYSLDLSVDMLDLARKNSILARLENVSFLHAPAEEIPLEENTIDAVIINGILNLCPDKADVLKEVHRVLRPDGRLLVSEIMCIEQDDVVVEGAACGLTLDDWFQ